MPRYEYSDDKSNKFWDISLSGSEVVTKWGRIGANGQTKAKSFGDEAAARKEYDKQIAGKVKKGYALVGDDTDDDSEASTGKQNPELEALIIAAPDDVDGYLVYGDWLQSQGEPLGELVQIQHGLASKPDDPALLASEEKLLNSNVAYFFGPEQSGHRKAPTLKRFRNSHWEAGSWEYGYVKSQWENGFIGKLYFHTSYYSEIDDAEELASQMLRKVLATPAARFITDLRFGELWSNCWEDGEAGMNHALTALAGAPCRDTLRHIHFEGGDHDLSGVFLDADELWKSCPNLETAVLYAGQLTLGHIHFPNGKKLACQTGGFRKAQLAQVVEAKMPKLVDLELWFGHEEYGADCSIDDLKPLLQRTDLRLTRLGLMNAEFGDAICQALPNAPIMKDVSTLDLTMGVITDEGAKSLIANKDAFPKLTKLKIRGYFSDEVATNLKSLAPSVLVANEGEEEYRYVEMGE